MTEITSMVAGLSGGGSGQLYSGPIGPTAAGPPLPAQSLSSNNNLASMSLSLFSGAAKAYGTMQSGKQEAAANNFKAQDSDLQAKQETLRGQQASNEIMDSLLQTVAAQRLAFAGNGADLNFGTPGDTEALTRKMSETQIGISNSNAAMSAISNRRQAAAYRQQAANTMSSASMNAGASVLQGGIEAWTSKKQLDQRTVNRG